MGMSLLLLILDILSPQKPGIPNRYKSNWASHRAGGTALITLRIRQQYHELVCCSINWMKKINRKFNRTDYNLKCIVDSFLLNIQ